jgi:uncharacterized protein (DUF111 family)
MAERHIHLDAVGGVGGDMFVAAMLDAVPSLRQRVFADLAAVMPAQAGQPQLLEGTSSGLSVLRFGLSDAPATASAHEHDHHHHHHHHHHDHEHDHHHDHRAEGTAPKSDCSFQALTHRITAAPMSAGSVEQAISILRVLAAAESRVHRQPIDQVQFHEIADWDSLMDVVAAGSIIAALPDTTWSVSDLPRGAGLVRTRHGLLPVPAPATVEILKGFSWRDDGIEGERVTPTGAAILAHLLASRGGTMGRGGLSSIGTGAGTRSLAGMPNILRALIFEAESATDGIYVLSFDIDDMTGEEIGIAQQRLRASPGVVDVTIGNRFGKKGRPVSDFRLLVRSDSLEAIRTLCFQETTTIGLRWRFEQRHCLEREMVHRRIGDHTLPVKMVRRPDSRATRKVESDSLTAHRGLAERRRLKDLAEKDEEQS